MDAELKKLEEDLRKLSPAALPADLFSRLDQAMCKWHESVPVEEKIIPFSAALATPRKKLVSWHTAAAVAALGGSVALWPTLSGTPSSETASVSPSNSVFPLAQTSSRSPFVPVNATTNLIKTSDRGIVNLGDGQPARCVAIQFQDQLQFRNREGQLLRVDQPAFKIIFVPLRAD